MRIRNVINTKRRNFWNTGLYTLLQALAIWIAFIALMLLWLSRVGDVQAVEMEISAGKSHYTITENGIWYQEGRDYHFDNKTNSTGLGLTGYAAESVRWHTGYMHLGTTTLWSIATRDEDFSGYGCISLHCTQNAILISKGSVEGVYFTLAPEFKYKDVKFFVETGLWVYQANFNVTIIDSDPQNRIVAQYKKQDALQLDRVYGFGIEYKNTQILASAWYVESHKPPTDQQPHYRSYTYNISIRQRF